MKALAMTKFPLPRVATSKRTLGHPIHLAGTEGTQRKRIKSGPHGSAPVLHHQRTVHERDTRKENCNHSFTEMQQPIGMWKFKCTLCNMHSADGIHAGHVDTNKFASSK